MDWFFPFEWLEASPLADFARSHPGVFATVQTAHLLSLAMLGGAVLVGDLRLLGLLLADVRSETVTETAQRWFSVALTGLVLSGAFMSSVVAQKLYYNEMFRAKMAALTAGIVFVYAVRQPLLRHCHRSVNPWALRMTALCSILLWFTVAACGRWIGFS